MIGNGNVMMIERELVRVRISSSTNEGGPKVLLHPPFTINRALEKAECDETEASARSQVKARYLLTKKVELICTISNVARVS